VFPLALLAALAAAPPARLTLDTVKDVRPLEPKSDDSPVMTVRKEAYNVRLAQVQRLAAGYAGGGAAFHELGPALRRLADSEADATGDPATGVRWLDLWLEVMDRRLAAEKQLYERGSTSFDDYLGLRVARLTAEIDVLNLKERLKAFGPPDPAAVLKLHEERVKVLAQLEDRKRKQHAAGAAAEQDALGAKAARLEAEVEFLKAKQARLGRKPD
jgi:hypothetical protein